MKVKDVMTAGIVTCHPTDSLSSAATLMWNNDFGALPVVDEQEVCIAMITDRDICMAACLEGKPLHDLRVSTAASRELVSVGEDDDVEVAEARMRQYRVHRVPVVDADGRPLGIVTVNDLLHHALPLAGDNVRGFSDELIATLAAVGAPREASFPSESGRKVGRRVVRRAVDRAASATR